MTAPSTLPPLDEQVARLAEQPARRWGARDAVLGLLAVPAVLLGAGLVLALVPGLPPAVGTALATVALAVVTVLVCRRAARRSGGWSAALGLDLPEWSDTGRMLKWSLGLLLAQALVVGLLGALVPALRGATPDNTSFLRDEPTWALLLFAVLAVGVAPVLEELLFRGLVLRGLMLRIGFWPAAVVSSVFFGAFHATGVDASALALVVATGVFGLGLCVLARRTGRLGPGIGVHALRNAVAVAAVALSG